MLGFDALNKSPRGDWFKCNVQTPKSVEVASMRQALFLSLLFFISTMSPLALGETTETQFKDGSTSYTHTFSNSGNGTAGVGTLPLGAGITSAHFSLHR